MAGIGRAGDPSVGSVTDLLAVAVLTVTAGVFVFVPPLDATPLRPVLAVAFVLLAPGYTYVGVLFPRGGGPRRDSAESPGAVRGGRLGPLERLVFSFGASVGLTILAGLVLGFGEPGITVANLYVALASLTAVGLGLAGARRLELAPEARTDAPGRTVLHRVQGLANQGARGVAVTGLFVVVVLLTAVSVGAGVGPSQDAGVTELYLLSENESGEYVPRGYPETLGSERNESLALGVDNREGRPVTYTALVRLEGFESNETGEPASVRRLRRFSVTLADGETERIEHSLGPDLADRDYRLTYLLYVGEPPADPSIGNAYREVHLWVRGDDTPAGSGDG